MQGKRYAVFSRFSVHTARVTHLIKIFTFYRKYAILCTKETRKSSFKGGTYGNLPACLADYKHQSKPYKRAPCARKHTVCAAVYIPARCKARPVARCHGRPAQRGVSRRRGVRLSQTLSPEDLAGSVLLLHCVNETGFFAHSEALVPEGNVNLNGDFPGDLSGTPGKRLAAFMEQEIMPFADYILDLHSGGGMEPLSPCLFFPVTAGENVLRTSLKMAAATGIEHLVASSAKTGFYSFAAQHGVPGLLLERGYGAMCREEDVSNYCTDVRGVLKAVNMLPGEPENTDKKTVWPKVDYLVAEHKGLWYPTVKKGDILPAGALLGEVRDFWNNPLGEYRTLCASRVLYHHTGLPLRPGDGLAACAHTEEAFILEDLEATVQRFLS